MDILDELESMAATIGTDSVEDDPISSESQVRCFQDLFQYSRDEAADIVERRRRDVSRFTVSDAHWEIVREDKEAAGYSKDAYEHAIEIGFFNNQQNPGNGQQRQHPDRDSDSKAAYLVKLEGPLSSAQQIQELTGALEPPTVVSGIGEGGEGDRASFCRIDGEIKRLILSSFPRSNPTFVRINMADKRLSHCSLAPTLGEVESTLPQHRANDPGSSFAPAQDQYPVWYFFYGTLADPDFLAKRLSLETRPHLHPATVTGAVMRSWGGKYKALVDGPASAQVDGQAYLLNSKEHEEQLRYFETDRYEVVRCNIRFRQGGEEESTNGLTFRFAG